jgi:trehalose 6-phosphate phosphatase
MLNILGRRQASLLEAFASSRALVAFDYDGTLSAIVRDRNKAGMRSRTKRLLSEVARRYPTAVVSGRARVDLIKCIGRVPIAHLVGNHGVEPWGARRRFAARVAKWAEHLEENLPLLPGMSVENKRYSITIHYRNVRDKRRAYAAIMRAVSALRGARVLEDRYAVGLLPRGAPHKGRAVRHLRTLVKADTVIYVGDDRTDEDAFRAGRSPRLISIRVGHRAASAAQYYLSGQRDIDRLLERLIALRPGGRR